MPSNEVTTPWESDPPMPQKWTSHRIFECEVRRSPTLGILLGYIVLPEGFLKEESSNELRKLRNELVDIAHGGGITWASMDGFPNGPVVGRPVLGIDTTHFGDLIPSLPTYTLALGNSSLSYKDFEYVKKNLEEIAQYLWRKLWSI